jgi:hypothetical protein
MVGIPRITLNASYGSMRIVVDLRKTALVSLVNLHNTTTVLTMDLSSRVTSLLALAAIGLKSTSCLAVASLQKLENKQPVSMRQSMSTEKEGVVTARDHPR